MLLSHLPVHWSVIPPNPSRGVTPVAVTITATLPIVCTFTSYEGTSQCSVESHSILLHRRAESASGIRVAQLGHIVQLNYHPTFSSKFLDQGSRQSSSHQPKPIVFVIDQDDSLRQRLKRLVEEQGFGVVEFADSRAFLEDVPIATHGCILLDIDTKGKSGLDVQRELSRRGCQCPVIFLAAKMDASTIVQAMKSGAFHFFLKSFDADTLMNAVIEATEEDRLRREIRNGRDALLARAAMLTPREMEVARLVVLGMLNKQIAADLGIVEKTVAVHRGRVMEKLGAQSVADLVRMIDRIDVEEKDHRVYHLPA